MSIKSGQFIPAELCPFRSKAAPNLHAIHIEMNISFFFFYNPCMSFVELSVLCCRYCWEIERSEMDADLKCWTPGPLSCSTWDLCVAALLFLFVLTFFPFYFPVLEKHGHKATKYCSRYCSNRSCSVEGHPVPSLQNKHKLRNGASEQWPRPCSATGQLHKGRVVQDVYHTWTCVQSGVPAEYTE